MRTLTRHTHYHPFILLQGPQGAWQRVQLGTWMGFLEGRERLPLAASPEDGWARYVMSTVHSDGRLELHFRRARVSASGYLDADAGWRELRNLVAEGVTAEEFFGWHPTAPERQRAAQLFAGS